MELTNKTKALMGIAVKGETISYEEFGKMFQKRSSDWWDAAAIIVDSEKNMDKIVWGLPIAINHDGFYQAVEAEKKAYKDYVAARIETNKILYDIQTEYDAFNQSQKNSKD